MTSLACAVCGEELPPQKPGARRIAHAGACSEARAKARAAALFQKRYAEQREEILERSREANRVWRAKNQQSEVARRSAWRAQNRDRMAASNREWVAANREKVRAKNARRRARLLGAFVEDVDRSVVWARDGGRCGVCGELVDPALPWPDKLSQTLDHIVPLSKGGTHCYSNVQIAHLVCNSRKNDSLSSPLR